MSSAPYWSSLGKPGPKPAYRKSAAPLPDMPPPGLNKAERQQWLGLREQLRVLGTVCLADAGLVRVLAKQLARLELLQEALAVQGMVRPDGTPVPLLKSIESLERTVAVNLNSLDLSPVRRRGGDAVVEGMETAGHFTAEDWVWDVGLKAVLAADDVAELEAYAFPKAVLDGVPTTPADMVGNKYLLTTLCRAVEEAEAGALALGRLLGDTANPFEGNPAPNMVSWIAAAWEQVRQGNFAEVLEAYTEE